MTIASTITQCSYTGIGSNFQFSFPNKVFSAGDLTVTVYDTSGNVYPFVNFANATLGWTYSVQNVDVDTGCIVVTSNALPSGWVIDLRSAIVETQSTSVKNQGQFLPELHEEAFDHATRLIQDLLRLTYTYGIHASDNEFTPWPALPGPTTRKGFALMFDASTGLPTLGFLSAQNVTQGLIAPLLNPQTSAEIAASVTPTNYAYTAQGPYLHLWRYMSAAQITSILGAGTVDTTSGFTAAMAVITQLNGATLIIPSGNYSNSSAVTLPPYCKIIGMGSRRGAGTPPSTGKGTSINATFAGPIFQVTNGTLIPVDILIEGINFQGNKGTYGAGNGIYINLCAGVTIRDCVVANFGTNNIMLTGAGAYALSCEHVYTATAGNANYYIDGTDSRLTDCQCDGAPYSVYVTANASNLAITGGDHYEGATTAGIYVLASRVRITDALVRITATGASGIVLGSTASECGISNCEIFGSSSTNTNIALDVVAGATAYRVTGCRLASNGTGAGNGATVRLAEGGTFSGNIVEPSVSVGVELISPPNQIGVIDGNFIYGVTNSILHTSGNGRWKLGTNRLDNAASPGTFMPMTVTAGFTLYGDYYDGAPPAVASVAALSLPQAGATTFSITGVTNITSINATGFQNKQVYLTFTGILTVTNGSNLKLTANFTTAAGSALTLFCDGTSFFEIGRKS